MTQKKYFNCMNVRLVLGLLFIFQVGYGQRGFTAVDQLLQQSQRRLGGDLALLVYKDGKTCYSKTLGTCTATTVAPIAGCSQWLTAALVMTFVEEGKLSLEDKVSQYLPIFATYGKAFLTLRQCLTHQTGIEGDKGGLLNMLSLSRFGSLQEEVESFASKRDIEENPGTSFRYSTVGLNIAGRVLEVIGKKPFDRLMQERLFRPLGMKNSSFASEKAVNPSGGARSSAADYLNFLAMLLNKGVFNGKRLLSEQSVAAMQVNRLSPGMVQYAVPKPTEGYGYGYGEWIAGTDAQGKALVVCCPGLSGTWPLVDYTHGYACLVFTLHQQNDPSRALYEQLKQAVDTAW